MWVLSWWDLLSYKMNCDTNMESARHTCNECETRMIAHCFVLALGILPGCAQGSEKRT